MKKIDISFAEYIEDCYKGIIASKIDMYNFIQIKTYGFQKEAIEYLVNDLRDYIYKIKMDKE